MSAKTKLGVQSKKNAKNYTINVEKKNVLLNAELFSDSDEEDEEDKKPKKISKASTKVKEKILKNNELSNSKADVIEIKVPIKSEEEKINDINSEKMINFYKDNEISPDPKNEDIWREITHGTFWEYAKFGLEPIVQIKLENYVDVIKELMKSGYNLEFLKKNENMTHVLHRVIKICDNDGNKKIINSQHTVELTMKYDLVELFTKPSGRLSDFKNNLSNVTYKLLGIYRGSGNVQSNLNTVKKLFDNTLVKKKDKNSESDENNDASNVIINKNIQEKTIWEFYSDFFKQQLTEELKKKLDYNSYYVYRIFKLNNQTQQYIFGSFDKYKKKDIETLCKKLRISFGDGDKEIEILEELEECYLECEGFLRVDMQIKKFDSIENGFNLFYNVINNFYFDYTGDDIEQMNKELFMVVQKNVMLNLFKDKNEYSKQKAYIFLIKSKIDNTKKFLYFGSENVILDNLKILYNLRSDNNVANFFGTVKFLDMEFTIVVDMLQPSDVYHNYLYILNQLNLDKEKTKHVVKINLNNEEKPVKKSNFRYFPYWNNKKNNK